MANSADGTPARIGFVGLGMMGRPMTACLAKAGHALSLYDIDAEAARSHAEAIGAEAAGSLAAAGEACDLVITMLPNAKIVRDAVLGAADGQGIADGLRPGGIVVDMSSSYPSATVQLGEQLAQKGIVLLDGPVSGGVAKAVSGTLAIMLGGNDAAAIERAEPVLTAMGQVFRTGPLGSGHAIKALNNYVSAAGLVAACEAVIVGRAFGLDPALMTDVFNASTGRNNTTERKIKPFVLTGEYEKAGFALRLMTKDVTAAADLAAELGWALPGLSEAKRLWQEADAALGAGADHTAMHKFLEGLGAKE